MKLAEPLSKILPVRVTVADDKRLASLATRLPYARKSDVARDALRRGMKEIEREMSKRK